MLACRMTDPAATQVIIIAEPEQALVELCGISLLERLLRMLQRLGIARATIVSASPDRIRTHLEPPSWARADLAVEVLQSSSRSVTAETCGSCAR
jgi:GTP:adenosylcobinamide-phosphate guanylyltransferase